MALREDQVAAAVRFLTNEKVAQSSTAEKQAFLTRKGLTSQEIAEALRRAASPGAAGAAATAGAAVAVGPAAPSAAAAGSAAPPFGVHRQVPPSIPGMGPAAFPQPQPGVMWHQGGAYPPWQVPGQAVPPAPPPPPWHLSVLESPAPWWALLLGGLGLGSALAFLGSLLWRRRAQQELTPGAVQWAGWDGQDAAAVRVPGQPSPSAVPFAGHLPLADAASWQAAAGPVASAPAVPSPAPPTPPLAVEATGAGAQGSNAGGADSVSTGRLEELTAQMRAHVQETREATASLRRTLDQQQWQYQRALSDFQLKMEEASRRKSTAASQRIEISPESLQMLRSMIAPVSTSNGTCPSLGAGSNGDSEALRHWFGQVESHLRRLLRSAGSKAEAKKHLQTTSLIVHNLVANPTQEKYREVNTSSARVRETFSGSDGGAAELLQLAGFERRDQAFVFPAEREFDAAERVRDILQDALRDCDKRWEQACGDDGADAAVQAGGGSGSSARGSSSGAAGEAIAGREQAAPAVTAGGPSPPAAPGSPGRRGPPDEGQEAPPPPWMARAPWASSAGRAAPPGQVAAAAGAGPAAGASSSSCSNGSAGPSAGAPAAGGGQAEPPKASAPWFSSVVQKQLSQLPAPGGSSRGAAPGAGSEEEAQGGSAPLGHGSLPPAAHPAEAREGLQEPQSGG